MAINFPNSPSLGQLYTYSATTWQWSGEYWSVYSAQTGYITSVSSVGGGYPVIDSVTSNSLTLKSFSGTNLTITDNGGLLNFYVPLNGGGGGQLYYFNISKTQPPYLELAPTATTSSEQTITSGASLGTTVLLGQFLTPSNYPNVSIIPGGVWSFYLHAYKEDASASFNIFCDVYKKTTGGTETLLLSTDPAPISSNSPTPIMVLTDTYFSGTTIDTSDRLLVNVMATNTGSSTKNVTFVSEGLQHYSYLSSPLLLRTADVFVNSFDYTPSANTLTIGQSEGLSPLTAIINTFSGLTISNTLNATTLDSTYANIDYIRDNGGTVAIELFSSARKLKGTDGSTTKFDWDSLQFPTLTNNGLLRVSGGTGSIFVNTTSIVTAVTLSSENVLSVTSDGLTTNTTTVNAVTGGTYNSVTGTITLSGTGNVNGNTIIGFSTGSGGLTWQYATSSITASTNNGYITTGTTSINLPTTASLGSTIEVIATTTDLFTITQNTNQFIRFGIITTTPTSGTLVSQNVGDSIRLICTSADTVFTVASAVGNITLN